MALQLTQKEKQLLQDQKTHEEVCIKKYQQGAQQASTPELKQLFQSYAQQEQQHLTTINAMLGGQVPLMNQSGGQQGQQTQAQQGSTQSKAPAQASASSPAASQADAALCQDMLMTEKYVSGAYDTAIFEFTDANVRQTLNHIQKEEQEHGEGIFNYMKNSGMYNVQ